MPEDLSHVRSGDFDDMANSDVEKMHLQSQCSHRPAFRLVRDMRKFTKSFTSFVPSSL
jgi:hypothetical protein